MCGSSSRAPALQVQSPAIKTQFHQKKNKQNLSTFSNVYMCADSSSLS
jgi:hypothetical protein